MNTFSTIIAVALLASSVLSAPTNYGGAYGTPCPHPMHPGARSYPSSQRRNSFSPHSTGHNNHWNNNGHHGHHGHNNGFGSNGFNNHGQYNGFNNNGFNNHGQNNGFNNNANNGQNVSPPTTAPASSAVPLRGSAISLENTDVAAFGNNTLSMAAEQDAAAISGNTEEDGHAIMGAVQPGGAVGFLGPLAGMFPFATPSV